MVTDDRGIRVLETIFHIREAFIGDVVGSPLAENFTAECNHHILYIGGPLGGVLFSFHIDYEQ